MYKHPRHARTDVGRLILLLCEQAARAERFMRMELMATLAGSRDTALAAPVRWTFAV